MSQERAKMGAHSRWRTAFAAGVIAISGHSVQGALVNNGTFELTSTNPDGTSNTGTFVNWSELASSSNLSPANSAKTNGVGGGLSTSPNGNVAGTAAVMLPGAGVLTQSTSTGSTWQFDVDFAMIDPGDSTTRGLQLLLYHTNPTVGVHAINLRVNGNGDIVVVSGASTANTLNLGGVKASFSIDANADGLLNTSGDSGDTVAVNHLTIVGNYATSPKYSVTLTNTSTSATASNVSHFQNSTPATGSGLAAVMFASNFSGLYVVDNVGPIPEPATMALASVVGMILIVGRRRPMCR